MWSRSRLGKPALVVVMVAAVLVTPATIPASAPRAAAQVTEDLFVSQEGVTPPADSPTSADRPNGNAWVVGVLLFAVAAGLIVGGRWWVRNRVGRLRD